MSRTVTVAVCTLNQWAMDFDGNYRRILQSIQEAKAAGATFRSGPELEICGYSCEDHFLEPDTILHSWEVLARLLNDSICEDLLIDVGMPVMHKNVTYNCRVVFLNRRILLIRPKMKMCDSSPYRESRWFTAWVKERTVEDHFLPRMITKITGQNVVPIGDAVIATSDTCVGFEICEELWVVSSSHIPMSLDGVEIISNASASLFSLRKAFTIVDLVKNASYKCGGCYMYNNFRGCDGGMILWNGTSSISVNGRVINRAKQFSLEEVEVTTATFDLEEIRASRNRIKSRCSTAAKSPPYPRVKIDFALTSETLNFSDLPIDIDTSVDLEDGASSTRSFYYTPEEEMSMGPPCWLWDYLRRSCQGGFFLPLSGGVDSSSTACMVYSMCTMVVDACITKSESRSCQGGFFLPLSGGVDSSSTACMVYSMCTMVVDAVKAGDAQALSDVQKIVGDPEYVPTDPKQLCNTLLVTCYMATENSSSETKARAAEFASQIGSYHHSVLIDTAVTAVLGIFKQITNLTPKFKAHGGSPRENLALQNVQARLRMVISYLFAQLMLWVRGRPGGLLVLGSSNVDESIRGYFTKYDCSSADINPIGGIAKDDLKRFLNYFGTKHGITALKKILDAPPTAELEPLQGGQLAQLDEVDMGMTYKELSTFGRLRKDKCAGPFSMFCKLVTTWDCPPEEVADKVKHFYRCYAINRHKMTVLTPACYVESYSPEDKRHDHRPFLYNHTWKWQFNAIDDQLKRFNGEVKASNSPRKKAPEVPAKPKYVRQMPFSTVISNKSHPGVVV